MFVPASNPLINEESIALRVDTMGAEIVETFGKGEPIIMLGLLRGCYVFAADLARAISRHGGIIGEIDFIIASSYGSGTVSSGNVKIERDARHDIADQAVLLVDDILDTGHTLTHVKALLGSRNPRVLKAAVMLDKPSRRQVDVTADFTGFSIEDHFVVGYGLDFDQRFRELPYITTMIERG